MCKVQTVQVRNTREGIVEKTMTYSQAMEIGLDLVGGWG